MNTLKLTFAILGMVLGSAMFVYGGYDDSPGGQGLGLIAVISGIVYTVRNRKKDSVN